VQLRSHRDYRSRSNKHRHCLKRRFNTNHSSAGYPLTGPVVDPGALRQVHHSTGQITPDYWRHEQVASDHELVVDVESVVVLLIVEEQWPENGNSSPTSFFQGCVQKRHQTIAKFEILPDYIFIVLPKPPGLVIVAVDLHMIATHRRQEPNLIP